MTPKQKLTIKKMIRHAIRWQNRQVLFTCEQCCFYTPRTKTHSAFCDLEETNTLMLSKRMPTQMPTCFMFDPLALAFAGVLTLMYAMGIDTLRAEHGWATIIGRLAARTDRYGYITGITQKNLDKYGTE